MISPCLMVPSAQIVCWLVLSLRNFTDPFHIRTLAPPGCALLRPHLPGFWGVLLDWVDESQLGYFGFGGRRTLPRLTPVMSKIQASPRPLVWFVRPDEIAE